MIELLFLVLGAFLGKIFFFNIVFEKKLFLKSILSKELRFYFFIPLSSVYTKFNFTTKEFKTSEKRIKSYSLISEILGGTLFFAIIFFLKQFSFPSNIILPLLLAFILFFATLLYLTIFDLLTFSIPIRESKLLILSAILINLVAGAFLVISGDPRLFSSLTIGSISNLVGGILLGGIIYLIVKLSKEEAMGSGDIEIMASTGFILGLQGALISFFWTLVLGSLIGIIYAFIVKKFKKVKIPFVPIILLGIIVYLFSRELLLSFFFITL